MKQNICYGILSVFFFQNTSNNSVNPSHHLMRPWPWHNTNLLTSTVYMTSDINSLFTSIQSTLFLLNITKHSSQNSFNSENLHLLYKKLIKKLSVNLPRPVQPSANIVGTHIKQRQRTPWTLHAAPRYVFIWFYWSFLY